MQRETCTNPPGSSLPIGLSAGFNQTPCEQPQVALKSFHEKYYFTNMVVGQLLAATDLLCEKSSRRRNPERFFYWSFWPSFLASHNKD